MTASAIVFDGVHKRFRRGNGHDTLAALAGAGLRRLFGRGSPARVEDAFWAVEDVSFRVAPGEAVGVIGPNGAGKSTVLKLLAGILRPERGGIQVRGRVTSLIEVGAGFHGDLTGRENIFLNGAILGMTRAEVRTKLDTIVDFAGIGPFLDTPVKRYSTGMQARLGFSIAAHVAPDILLVDEVLSVGDAVFRVRCLDHMSTLVRSGVTLLFVSHNLEQVRRICPRTLVLRGGQAVFDGPTDRAIEQYITALMRDRHERRADVCGRLVDGADGPRVLGVGFRDAHGTERVAVTPREALALEVRYWLPRPIERLVVEVNLRRDFAQNVVSLNSLRDGVTFAAPGGESSARVNLKRLPLAGGQYFWNVRLWDAERGTIELDTPFDYPLLIDDGGEATGMLTLQRTWTDGPPAAGASGTDADRRENRSHGPLAGVGTS
jgi:ABC-type polysaccharide/polyol phosphate transport system ATPase subunit